MKYPKTLHLPDSPSRKESAFFTPYKNFEGTDLIITEKLDGANVGLSRRRLFSRSGETPKHSSFDRLKALHAAIRWRLPANITYYGEWCEAIHHFKYTRMSHDTTGRFFVFAIYDSYSEEFLSWSDTVYISKVMGLITVPPLAFSNEFKSFSDLRDSLYKFLDEPSALGGEREGVVIRKVNAFPVREFQNSVAKYAVNFSKGDVIEEGYTRQ